MTEKYLVKFHTLKKCYTLEELIVPAFTISGFTPSKCDWVGVFPLDSKSSEKALTYEWIPTISKDQPQRALSLCFKIDFVPAGDHSNCYEIRYIDGEGKCRGRTESFNITSIAPPESLITVKEGASFDENLVLIDKVSPFEGIECDKNTGDVAKDLEESENNLQLIQEELETVVTQNDSPKEDSIEMEFKSRKQVESVIEELSRQLGDQMKLFDCQNQELIELRNICDREKHIKESLKEECEAMQENTETFATEIEDMRVIATNYKSECSRMKKKIEKDQELLDRLKIQILDDRDQHEEEILKVRDTATDEIAKLQNNTLILENTLEKERENLRLIEHKLHRLEEEHANEVNDKNAEIFKHQETIENLKKESEGREKCHKELVDENEKVIRELESRVANESSNASRLQNEIEIAENRYKEATEDIKFFRQQFIETEQKLTKSQQQLSKITHELTNLKFSVAQSNVNDAMNFPEESTITQEETTKSKKFADDKSNTTCDSVCVSSCASTETLVSVDRRRLPGDVTDFTDDESFCSDIIKSPSLESMVFRASEPVRPTAGLIHLNREYRYQSNSSPVPSHQSESSNVQMEGTQPIPTVITTESRRSPKKGRRRFSKPIDLSSCTSFNYEKKDSQLYHVFAKDVSDIDRMTLERQYAAIRQHRNSLIRENTYLKNKVCNLKTDVMFLNNTLQNVVLEADYRLGMMHYSILSNPWPYVQQENTQSSAEETVDVIQTDEEQTQVTSQNASNPGNSPPKHLSPYAAEYTPAYHQQQLFPIPIPPTQEAFFNFITQQADHGYFLPIPPHLPSTPMPSFTAELGPDYGLIDVSDQLANIGVPVTKNV